MTRAGVSAFDDVLAPVARQAFERLCGRVASIADLQDEPALGGLRSDLEARLAHVSARLLYEGFADLRRSEQGGASTPGDEYGPGAAKSRRLYDRHVRSLLAGGWEELLGGHPEFARILDLVSADWEDASAEFIARVAEDRKHIRDAFGEGAPLGGVTHVASGLSDPHHHGRTVCTVTFESGVRVVYKPRDVGIEASFAALVGWLNRRGLDPPLRAARTLPREGYGWSEFVPAAPCADEAAARRFYHRAGGLACLLDVFGATDMHYGNVIASAEHPVVVDLETLCQPRLSVDAQAGDTATVLRTGFAPVRTPAPDGRSYDVSGLGAVSRRATEIPRLAWLDPATDAMRPAPETIPIPLLANVPTVGDRPLAPADFSGEILEGYGSVHRFLASQAHDLLAAAGPLAPLFRQRTRVLLRHTVSYRLLLEESLAPRNLRDGQVRQEVLASGLAVSANPESPAHPHPDTGLEERRVHSETAALLRLDIPRFSTFPDDTSLEGDGGFHVEAWFDEPGSARVRRRLERLDEADLDRNRGLLKTALDLVRLEGLIEPA